MTKITQLQKLMKNKEIDACVFFNSDTSFLYFSRQKNGALIIIPSKGKPWFFLSKLESPSFYAKKSFNILSYEKNLFSVLKIFFKEKRLARIGVNENALLVRSFKELKKFCKTTDFSSEISFLRSVKTGEEIKIIKKACSLTEKIFCEIASNFNFKNEKEVVDYILFRAFQLGCELSFPPIVASGKNASIPHHDSNSNLQKGFLILDFGLKYKGYCADITRTFYLGKPTNSEIKKYDALSKLQTDTIKKVRAGISAKDIELFVRKSLGEKEKLFIHSLGHGVGLDVHENPVVSKNSSDILCEGMVITIEPGLYNKNSGIRIEDVVLVGKKHSKTLSTYPKKLFVIPKV